MEKLNTAKVLRRVHWLCGWEMRMPNERFNVLRLTNMPKDSDKQAYVQRFDMIRLAIDLIRPDVMFVDGLRDLLASINDEESITKTLDYFSGVAEESKMSIWMALHQNPNRKNDEDGLKMRGWAGTELGNKVSDTLVSIKTKTANGVTFTVKQQDARDKDIDDWKFEVTDDAGKLGIPKIISNGGTTRATTIEADSEADIREWIHKAAQQYQWPMSRKSVKQTVFGEIGGVKNDGRQQADLMVAINTGMLVESTIKSGGYYMLTPNEQLPF